MRACLVAKRDAARRAGADEVADSIAAVRDVDVVYDSIGTTLIDSLAAARTGGSVVSYGMAGGDPPAVDPRVLMDRTLRLIGAFAVAGRSSLDDGAAAHRALEGRGAIGKILLLP